MCLERMDIRGQREADTQIGVGTQRRGCGSLFQTKSGAIVTMGEVSSVVSGVDGGWTAKDVGLDALSKCDGDVVEAVLYLVESSGVSCS